MPDRQHGLIEPRGLTNTPRQRSYDGRFGRMFQRLAVQPAHDPSNPDHERELRQIADSMRERSGRGQRRHPRWLPPELGAATCVRGVEDDLPKPWRKWVLHDVRIARSFDARDGHQRKAGIRRC